MQNATEAYQSKWKLRESGIRSLAQVCPVVIPNFRMCNWSAHTWQLEEISTLGLWLVKWGKLWKAGLNRSSWNFLATPDSKLKAILSLWGKFRDWRRLKYTEGVIPIPFPLSLSVWPGQTYDVFWRITRFFIYFTREVTPIAAAVPDLVSLLE